MDVIEAINSRMSIRSFKPDSVSKETIEKILEVAVKAPSAMNTQPWEFAVISGEVIEKIKQANIESLSSGTPAEPEHSVVSWPKESVYRTRQVELAIELFKLMDIRREDKEKRMQWMQRGFRYFDAPCAILLLTDKLLSESSPLMDVGAVTQNICLAALKYDLGTCIEDQGVMYPKNIRNIVDIPESKRIIIAIAIGYPDDEFPANKLKTNREPIKNITRWHGY